MFHLIFPWFSKSCFSDIFLNSFGIFFLKFMFSTLLLKVLKYVLIKISIKTCIPRSVSRNFCIDNKTKIHFLSFHIFMWFTLQFLVNILLKVFVLRNMIDVVFGNISQLFPKYVKILLFHLLFKDYLMFGSEL